MVRECMCCGRPYLQFDCTQLRKYCKQVESVASAAILSIETGY